MTFRAGPDILSDAVLAEAAAAGARWIAYWYRHHAACVPGACWCWLEIRRGERRFGDGEGVAFVVFRDGTIGCYPLRHGAGEPALDWSQACQCYPRLTPDSVAALRAASDGAPPTIQHTDGTQQAKLPAAAAAVWEAWDAGVVGPLAWGIGELHDEIPDAVARPTPVS